MSDDLQSGWKPEDAKMFGHIAKPRAEPARPAMTAEEAIEVIRPHVEGRFEKENTAIERALRRAIAALRSEGELLEWCRDLQRSDEVISSKRWHDLKELIGQPDDMT